MTRRGEDLDVDDTLYIVTDNLGKADAFITAAERLIEDPGGGIEGMYEDDEDGEHDEASYGHGDDNDPGRLRNNLAHLIESTKLAVRAAQYAHSRAVAKVNRHRAESAQSTSIAKHRGKA